MKLGSFLFWVLTDTNGNLIGIDKGSGGYPYVPSHFSNVHLWSDEDEAFEYSNHWPGKFNVRAIKVEEW